MLIVYLVGIIVTFIWTWVAVGYKECHTRKDLADLSMIAVGWPLVFSVALGRAIISGLGGRP